MITRKDYQAGFNLTLPFFFYKSIKSTEIEEPRIEKISQA